MDYGLETFKELIAIGGDWFIVHVYLALIHLVIFYKKKNITVEKFLVAFLSAQKVKSSQITGNI